MYIITLVNKKTILVPRNTTFFQKHCCLSPACPLCDAPVEVLKHYFLYWPSFAALRETLFASVAQLLGNRWHCASDKKKNRLVLKRISDDDFDTDVMFFSMIQSINSFPTFLLTSALLCMFCSIVTCNMHCKQHKLSRWALFALRAKEKH